MKKSLQKLICSIIIVIMTFNVFFPIISSADVDINEASNGEIFLDELGSNAENVLVNALDGIIGIIFWVVKLPIYAISKILFTICSATTSGGNDWRLTPDDIIFTGASDQTNKIDLININFFDKSDDSMITNVRTGIAGWYYALRNLAIVISLVVLIYVGIRMAISAVASEKAKYKNMLKDWLMGFAMLFLLHYIMVAIIAVNNELVNLIYKIVGGNNALGDLANKAEEMVFSPWFLKSFAALTIYAMLAGITIAFFVMYVKRFFTIGFLITISPLITITYSIDKMGDGRSQALDTWFKEFIFNILIQPFHCIIYALLCSTAINALTGGSSNDFAIVGERCSLQNILFAILSLLFVFKAEDIVKNIFGFKAGSMENVAAAGALAWGAMSKFASGGSKAAKAAGKVEGGGSIGSTSDMKKKNGTNQTTTPRPSTQNNKVPSRFASSAIGKGVGKIGSGISKVGSATVGKTAFGKAVAEAAEKKREDLKNFDASEAAKRAIYKAKSTGFKMTSKLMLGGAVAGLTGDATKGLAAGYAFDGLLLTPKMTGYADKDLDKLQEASYAKRLANAMDNYRMANDNISDEELYNKCLDLYDKDVENLTDPAEKKLASRLQDMAKLYAGRGEEDPAQKVMNKVENIQLGNTKHAIKIKTDNVVAAAQDLRSHGMDKTAIETDSSRIMQEIDDSTTRGENYFKSDAYDSLGKTSKKLAKEIYKTKEMMSTIGTASQDKVNEELQRALNEKLS